jgi:hypothetical protein
MDEQWLNDADSTLTKLVANLLQVSHKDSSKLVNVVMAKASGAAGAAGVLGLISAFGTASTGTAIAGLSGAAASSATLYWLGSLVCGGAVVGGFMTGGIAIAAGYFGLNWWKGKPRKPEDLTDEEKAIVDASLGLIKAFREQRESNVEVKPLEGRFVFEKAWSPLVERVKDYNKHRAAKTINFKNNVGLIARCTELDELTQRLTKWTA